MKHFNAAIWIVILASSSFPVMLSADTTPGLVWGMHIGTDQEDYCASVVSGSNGDVWFRV